MMNQHDIALVPVVIGIQMLHGGISPFLSDSRQAEPEDQLWVPMVTPLTAGPAAITTVITLTIE